MRKILLCGLAATAIAFEISGAGATANNNLQQGKTPLSAPLFVEIQSAPKEVSAGAENFIDSMGHRAIGFLSDPELSSKARKEEFRKLLEDSFDLKTIGRWVLGRYWRIASKDQRSEYQKLFEDMIVAVYSRRFEEYNGQKFEIISSRAKNERDVLVASKIISKNDPEVRVDWLVRYKNGQYKIVDVIVEGVSMSITQRSDFSSIIQRGGGNVQVLIDHLKEQKKT